MVFFTLLLSASAVDPSCAPGFTCTSASDCHQMPPAGLSVLQMMEEMGNWVACVNSSCVVKTLGTLGQACNDMVVCPLASECMGSPMTCTVPKPPTCSCTADAQCDGVCNGGMCAPSNMVPVGGACTRSNGQDCVDGSYCNSTMMCQSDCATACTSSQSCDSMSGMCITNCDYGYFYNSNTSMCQKWKMAGDMCSGMDSECGILMNCNGGMCASVSILFTLGQVCGKNQSFGFETDGPCAAGLYCSSSTGKCMTANLAIGATCMDMGSCAAGGICTLGTTMTMTCQATTAGKACSSSTDCNGGALQCMCSSTTASVCVDQSSIYGELAQVGTVLNAINQCFMNAQLPSGCWAAVQVALSAQDVASLSADCKSATAKLMCCARCADTVGYMDGTWAMINSGAIKLSCNPPSITTGATQCNPMAMTPITCGAPTLVAQLVLAAVMIKTFIW